MYSFADADGRSFSDTQNYDASSEADNPGSDDTIEKEEHYKWTIALEEETKEYAVIPEEDLLEQAEPEVAERLILKRDLRKAAIARMAANDEGRIFRCDI